MADPISGSFRAPFAEQLAALRLRLGNLVGTRVWTELERSQHDRAFMVAGAMEADLLADLAKAVDKAVAEGTGLEAFRKDFRAIVEKNGWHGWNGEGTAKGEAWRMRTIYRTNMATTYAAGRMAQLVDGKFAFWVYKHGGSLEPRLQHLAWNGVALPPDHPFWAEHYPPNGWGCSCRVFGARSEAGIKRVGGVPGKALPDGWAVINPKTGAPVGIDKGWDYAPGATVSDDINAILGRKVATLPAELGSDLGDSLARQVDEAWAKWVAETLATGRTKPTLVGVLSQDVIKALDGEGIAPASADMQIGPGLLAGPKATRHEQKGDALLPDDWLNLPERLRAPTAVLLDTQSGKLLYVLPAEAGHAQLAVYLDYLIKGSDGGGRTNMVISAYRPVLAEVQRRLANGALKLLSGTLG